MTEQDIEDHIITLIGAIEPRDRDEEVVANMAIALLTDFLITQKRIAATLEDIRRFGIGQNLPSGDRP